MQHQDWDWWNEAVVFISKDDNLNKAHVKYLEFSIYDSARQVDRYSLWNRSTPNRPAISETEQAVMAEFFGNLKLLVGALGYRLFEPLTDEGPTDRYSISAARGAHATGTTTNEGFVVLKGSKASGAPVPSTPEPVLRMRQKLIDSGVLQPDGDALSFTSNHLFSSPSAAAAVVLGRSANGRIEWKNDQGMSLKDIEESQPGD
jgi:hypothetical protein